MNLALDRVPSPIGTLLLVSDGEALCLLEFEDHEGRLRRALNRLDPAGTLTPGRTAHRAIQHIAAYFDGNLNALDGIPVRPCGTAFQHRVWGALRRIPPATTTTYGRLADAICAPRSSRAVGLANGANPIAIVIPCHRVIGADASLTGYGGGLHRKAWLLRHEAANASPPAP
jgi:methylated-DNA-[protein]-cysteine S-methyltransferase